MNVMTGKDANGKHFLVVALEPENIHRLKQGEPINLRVDDMYPDGIPRKLNLTILHSETPVTDAKEMKEKAKVFFDERTPLQPNRPHCPECHSTIEQLAVGKSDQSPMAIVFCPTCGCCLGLASRESLVSGA